MVFCVCFINVTYDFFLIYVYRYRKNSVAGLGNKPPVMTNTVSVEIDLAREIYER